MSAATAGLGCDCCRDATEALLRTGLPECEALEDPGIGADWDSGNHIGGMSRHMADQFGVRLDWMSWLDDRKEEEEDEKGEGSGAKVTICRVYAHRLSHETPTSLQNSGVCQWVNQSQLQAAAKDGQPGMSAGLRRGEMVATWAQMWTTETDAQGAPMLRGFGVSQDRSQDLRFGQPDPTATTDELGRFIVGVDSLRDIAEARL